MADSPQSDPLPDLAALTLLLARADNASARALEGELSSHHGLSRNDFAVLRQLYDARPGGLRRVDLAERVGLTPSGVTRLLIPLERVGLVTRAESTADRRAAVARLTPTGVQLVADASASAQRAAERLFRAFTWEETDTLRELLGRLMDR